MSYLVGSGLALIVICLILAIKAAEMPVRQRNSRVLGGSAVILSTSAVLIGALFPSGFVMYGSISVLLLGSLAFIVAEERARRKIDSAGPS